MLYVALANTAAAKGPASIVSTLASSSPAAHDDRMTRDPDEPPASGRRFRKALESTLARWSQPIKPAQLDQLCAHFAAVIKANRVMNLTRITDPVESAVKHYADSLALLRWVKLRGIEVRTILDVGTGAGFPAVPLAVMRPDWSITAIDATRKKIEFARQTADAIGLTNIRCEHAHSRHWNPGRTSDVVTFRALRKLRDALSETAHLVAKQGWLIAYKTALSTHDDRRSLEPLLAKLRLIPAAEYPYSIQYDYLSLKRVLWIYRRLPA